MDQKKQNQEKKERKKAPSPLHPPTRVYFFMGFPCYLHSFFHKHRFFGCIFSFLICIYIHRDLSLCASFLVRIAGGGAAPSPLHPPTRFYFLMGFPCYLHSFFHKHHRLFGFILSLLISSATCAYVLLSWYALRGEALRPPPCTPPPAFIV